MNEIINPPCNSLLAAFFELSSEVCLKKASSCWRRLIRPKRTISQQFKCLFPLPILMSPNRKLLEREARRVLLEVQRDQMKEAVCARQRRALRQMWRMRLRTLMLLVEWTWLGSLDTSLRDSRSQKSCVEKDWRRRMCPRVPFDTAHLPQFEFSNLHHLPLALLLEFLCSPVIEFFWATCAARAET